jgi:hypothetical protein
MKGYAQKCEKPGCCKRMFARSLCSFHYNQARFRGDFDVPRPEKPRWEYLGKEEELFALQGEQA